MRKMLLISLTFCCMIFAGDISKKNEGKIENYVNDENILGVYKTISNGYFGETLVLESKGVCYYSMFSDVKTEEPEPKNVKGVYSIQNNKLTFSHGVREIRKINGIYTLWRDDSIREWEEKKRYRSYGIMIKCIKGEFKDKNDPEKTTIYYYGNDTERIMTNDVAGVEIKPNKGQILNIVPEKFRKEFKKDNAGKLFIKIEPEPNPYYGMKCYEYNPDKHGFHVKQGIKVQFYPGNKQIETIKESGNRKQPGLCLLFYKDGKPRFKQYFRNGNREGLCQHWNSKARC